jgi:hypothetical protein
MSDKTRLFVDVACNIFEILINLLMKIAFPFSSGDKELRIRPYATDGRYVFFGPPVSPGTIDSRIQKIDVARAGLTEALSAIDELKNIAEGNKRDLALLNYQIQHAEAQRQSVSGELDALKEIASLDSESVRKALRLPTRVSIWTERVIAFVLGVLASVLASLIYEYIVKKLI